MLKGEHKQLELAGREKGEYIDVLRQHEPPCSGVRKPKQHKLWDKKSMVLVIEAVLP